MFGRQRCHLRQRLRCSAMVYHDFFGTVNFGTIDGNELAPSFLPGVDCFHFVRRLGSGWGALRNDGRTRVGALGMEILRAQQHGQNGQRDLMGEQAHRAQQLPNRRHKRRLARTKRQRISFSVILWRTARGLQGAPRGLKPGRFLRMGRGAVAPLYRDGWWA